MRLQSEPLTAIVLLDLALLHLLPLLDPAPLHLLLLQSLLLLLQVHGHIVVAHLEQMLEAAAAP